MAKDTEGNASGRKNFFLSFFLLCSLFEEMSGKKEFAFLFKATKVNLHFSKNCGFFSQCLIKY